MAFKLKHKGATALMKSLSAMPGPARKAPMQKSPIKKDDPGDKKKPTEKKTTTSGDGGMFPERGTVEEREMKRAYESASPAERRKMRREFQGRMTENYGKTSGDEAYNKMRAREKELEAKYTQQFGDPTEKNLTSEQRLSRTDAIRANVAADVGRADYRSNRNSMDSSEYSDAMKNYKAEQSRLGEIYDLHMQGKSYSKYEKPTPKTAGAAKKVKSPVKKIGVGSKSIRQRIQEDAQKKKSAPTTKKMYKK